MKTNGKVMALAACAVLLAACATPRDVTYLQDMKTGEAIGAPAPPALRLVPGDKLQVEVLSENEQLSAPFNEVMAGTASNARKAIVYTVNSDGSLDFPVLGNLQVQGLTLAQVRDLIAGEIRRMGFIRDPLVNVSLQNFKIMVLGNVHNSELVVEDPSINILQVIARSGGTSGNVKIKDVTVFRTEADKVVAYSVNLKSKDLYSSPVFYLQQNDIVYFKPKGSTFSSEGEVVMRVVGTGLSLGSMITNIILWTSRR